MMKVGLDLVRTTYEYDFQNVRAFCANCEAVHLTRTSEVDDGVERVRTPEDISTDETYDLDAHDWECPHCGERMEAFGKLSSSKQAVVKFQLWSGELHTRGLTGPSPGGAAGDLGCSRAMIDKLVDLGVLERCEYNEDGHRVVMISSRSIEAAKEAKAIRGRWTDATVVQEVLRKLGKDSGGSDNEKA